MLPDLANMTDARLHAYWSDVRAKRLRHMEEIDKHRSYILDSERELERIYRERERRRG